jgi:hypothetical protein
VRKRERERTRVDFISPAAAANATAV